MKQADALRKLRAALAAALLVTALAAVFASYLRPGFMLDIANRIWLCF